MFKKKIKKIDLAKNLSSSLGFSKRLSVKIIDDIIKILIDNIKLGSLNLKNVGSFKILKKKERIGRNPKTKEEFIISSRKSVSYVVSKNISQSLEKTL